MESRLVKFCNGCKTEKSTAEFHKNKAQKSGFVSRCILCEKIYKEKTAEKRNARRRELYHQNLEKNRARNLADYYKHHDKRVASCRRYKTEHKERLNKNSLEKYYFMKETTPELIIEYRRVAWENRRNNPEKWKILLARSAARKSRVKHATPTWANKEEIAEIYKEASLLREKGIEVHVDHIVPINGKTVCGLHVPNNLQILPKSENLSKSNKF